MHADPKAIVQTTIQSGRTRQTVRIVPYLLTTGAVFGLTLTFFIFRPYIEDQIISLLYLLLVLFCASVAPASITIYSGVLSFLCYDFFLLAPIFDFRPHHPVQLLDPLAFLIVAIVTSVISMRSRQHAVQTATYKQASQFRTTLLHLISHNLRTPVATIKMALTGLLLADLTPDQHDLIDAANQEADRLNRIIGNVLQISKLDANAIHLHKEWNSVHELVGSACSRWKSTQNQAKTNLIASVPSSLSLVEFDFDLMEHVLINLIENAFRHGKPPVHVSAEAHPDELWIKVEDCGSGEVIMLDTPSGELLSKTTNGSGGLGLGLAVCKGLVEVHQGRIWNERINTPTGSRTTFFVSIPMSVYQD